MMMMMMMMQSFQASGLANSWGAFNVFIKNLCSGAPDLPPAVLLRCSPPEEAEQNLRAVCVLLTCGDLSAQLKIPSQWDL